MDAARDGPATYSSAGASYGYATLWMLPVMALLLIVVQETAARCGCVTGKGFASLIREKFGAGASYGYATLWMLPVMALLLIVVQETAARCGCVTGKGFASLIREKFGVRKTALAMIALLIANTAVTISEFAGIASGLALFGIPKTVSVPLMGMLIWLLTMSGSFRRIEKILLLVSCVFVTYVVAAFLAGPNWGEVALSTITPSLIPEPSYVSLLVATIGCSGSPRRFPFPSWACSSGCSP